MIIIKTYHHVHQICLSGYTYGSPIAGWHHWINWLKPMVVLGEMIGLQREIIIMKSRNKNLYATNVRINARIVLSYTWQVLYYINYVISSIFIQQNINVLHVFFSSNITFSIHWVFLDSQIVYFDSKTVKLAILPLMTRSDPYLEILGKILLQRILCNCAVNSLILH